MPCAAHRPGEAGAIAAGAFDAERFAPPVRVLQQARHGGAMDQRRQTGDHWTRLSCHRFRANEVRLQLSVLAYNLGNLSRRLILPP